MGILEYPVVRGLLLHPAPTQFENRARMLFPYSLPLATCHPRLIFCHNRCPTLHVDTPFSCSLSSCTPPAIHSPAKSPQRILSSSTIFYNLTHEVNCTSFGLSIQVLGNISIGTATLNILYRAWAISRKYGRLLTTFLAIAEVGHWAILIWNAFTVHSEWVLAIKECNTTPTSRPALVTLYVYSMCPFPLPGFTTTFIPPSLQQCFSTLPSS